MCEFAISENDYEEAEKEFVQMLRRDFRILKAIKSTFSDEFYNELLDIFEYYGKCWDCSIESKPKGEIQSEENFKLIKSVWKDEHCHGGYSGDEFYGCLYIKLERKNKKDKYLKANYSNY